jgi:hypothetical protein
MTNQERLYRARANGGISTLDYFAGQALGGIMAGLTSANTDRLESRSDVDAIVKRAYAVARAMVVVSENAEQPRTEEETNAA